MSAIAKSRILRVTAALSWMESGIDLHTHKGGELLWDIAIALICGFLASEFLVEARTGNHAL